MFLRFGELPGRVSGHFRRVPRRDLRRGSAGRCTPSGWVPTGPRVLLGELDDDLAADDLPTDDEDLGGEMDDGGSSSSERSPKRSAA